MTDERALDRTHTGLRGDFSQGSLSAASRRPWALVGEHARRVSPQFFAIRVAKLLGGGTGGRPCESSPCWAARFEGRFAPSPRESNPGPSQARTCQEKDWPLLHSPARFGVAPRRFSSALALSLGLCDPSRIAVGRRFAPSRKTPRRMLSTRNRAGLFSARQPFLPRARYCPRS